MNIMAERPKQTISQPNYAELADLKIPRTQSVKKTSLRTRGVTETVENELYRLNVLERDIGRGLAKVRYVGYGAEFDEWRPMDDIIELSDGSSSDDQTAMAIVVEFFSVLHLSIFVFSKSWLTMLSLCLFQTERGIQTLVPSCHSTKCRLIPLYSVA